MKIFKKVSNEEIWDVPQKQVITLYSLEYPSRVVEMKPLDQKHFNKWKKKKGY